MISGSDVSNGADGKPTTASGRSVGLTGQVARGSLWSFGGQLITVLVAFVTTPLVIRLLGPERYGVWALINLLIGYLSVSDLGMGAGSTRFGSEAHARGDDDGEAGVIWAAIWINIGPTLGVVVVLVLFSRELLDRVLYLPAYLQEEAAWALQIAAFGFFARTLAGVLNTPQLVRMKFETNTLINTISSLAQSCLVPVVFWAGSGLIRAAALVAGVNALTAFGHTLVSQKLLPQLRLPRWDGTLLRRMAKFGAGMMLSTMAFLLVSNAERLLLTRAASVRALAHYSVAQSLASLLVILPQALGQALLPALSRLYAAGDLVGLQALYRRVVRGIMFSAPPLALVICVSARPFFRFWAGAEFERESSLPLFILMAGFVFCAVCYAPFNVVLAAGRSDLTAKFHLFELLLYLPGAALLTWRWGAVGAAMAWSLRMILDTVLFLSAAKRLSGGTPLILPEQMVQHILLLAGLILPSLILAYATTAFGWKLFGALVSLVVYAFAVWRLLADDERQWLQTRVDTVWGYLPFAVRHLPAR